MTTEREEFVALASQEGTNVSALCAQFGISRQTGYKWLARFRTDGTAGLRDRSRRPHTSPERTAAAVEAQVLALRAEHPAWGGRTRHHRLLTQGEDAVPAPSTITAILRFEHPAPNDLLPMDFMGHRALETGRVHHLTLVDDHSRFALLVAACANEQQETVFAQLTGVFRRYGLPRAILSDHGSPWASAGMGGITTLEAWLLRLGIRVTHGRAYHPQTQGTVERFHATIAAEVFAQRHLTDLGEAQLHFDRFRACYNQERPHESLDYAVPVSRSQISPRPFPDPLPPVIYGPDDIVRIVTQHGSISWQGRRRFIGRGLVGEPVALRPTLQEGVWIVVYCHRQVAMIALNDREAV